MSAFSPRQMFLLDMACAPIRAALPVMGVYLVGTATGRGPHRDVDVRAILRDKAYDRLERVVSSDGMAFLGLAIGQYLASLTGLPIDFQLQRMTEANHHHGGKPRNPLGTRTMVNFAGDAPRTIATRTPTLAEITKEAQRCDAHDVEGLRCVRPTPHPGQMHKTPCSEGGHWLWEIDCGPPTTTTTPALAEGDPAPSTSENGGR